MSCVEHTLSFHDAHKLSRYFNKSDTSSSPPPLFSTTDITYYIDGVEKEFAPGTSVWRAVWAEGEAESVRVGAESVPDIDQRLDIISHVATTPPPDITTDTDRMQLIDAIYIQRNATDATQLTRRLPLISLRSGACRYFSCGVCCVRYLLSCVLCVCCVHCFGWKFGLQYASHFTGAENLHWIALLEVCDMSLFCFLS